MKIIKLVIHINTAYIISKYFKWKRNSFLIIVENIRIK